MITACLVAVSLNIACQRQSLAAHGMRRQMQLGSHQIHHATERCVIIVHCLAGIATAETTTREYNVKPKTARF